jgi:hypothetical protein
MLKRTTMNQSVVLCAAAAALLATGCQSQSQMLADEQTVAMQAVSRRAQFEMACPQATGTVLSQTLLQPVLFNGIERSEYTIGMTGCGKRAVYVAVCQIGNSACVAASSPDNRLGTP